MELNRKSVSLSVKSFDDATGTATFIASVFGNLDHDEDIIVPGAFSKSLEKRRPKFIADHNWSVAAKLGKVLDSKETSEGLEITVEFGLHNPLAKQVYEDFKFDPEQEFSIGFTIPKGGSEFKNGVRYIKSAELYEVSNVLVGANPATRLVGVKSADGGCCDCENCDCSDTSTKNADIDTQETSVPTPAPVPTPEPALDAAPKPDYSAERARLNEIASGLESALRN